MALSEQLNTIRAGDLPPAVALAEQQLDHIEACRAGDLPPVVVVDVVEAPALAVKVYREKIRAGDRKPIVRRRKANSL